MKEILNLRISLKFMSHNVKKFLMLLLTITIGTAIFYFILNIANTLEKKAFRVGSEGSSHIYINYGYDMDDNEFSELKLALFELSSDIDNIYFSRRVNVRLSSGTGASNIIVYDNNDDLKDVIGLMQFNDKDKIKDLSVSNSTEYDFEGIFNVHQAAVYPHHNPDVPDDYVLEDYIGTIVTRVDQNTNNIYKIKVADIYYTDVPTKSNTIFTVRESVEHIDFASIGIIQLNVKNPLDSSKVVSTIKPFLLDELNVEEFQIVDWQVNNEFIVNLIYVERISIILIQLLTAVAIAIGISNVIAFDVKEKTNQIGILKAIGYTNKKAVSLFHLQASIISFLGVGIGILFGNLLSIIFSSMFKNSSGIPLLYMNQSFFNYWSLLTIIVMLAFNQLGMIIPSRNVKKLQIIEIIKAT